MDKRVIQERMRQKKRQMLIRKYTRLATYAIAAVLVVVFVIKGVIFSDYEPRRWRKRQKSHG